MSKIQDALRKLQQQGGNGARVQGSGAAGRMSRQPETVIPIVEAKRVPDDEERHHLDEKSLIRGGLLAPLEQAIPVADEFRRIKRPLIDNAIRYRNRNDERMNMIAIASPTPGVGKTFCAMNLAASVSLERELNVLLVDGDVAKPHISHAVGLGDRVGLIDMLEDESISIGDVIVRTDLNDIQILPAGRKHSQSTELLASERMAGIMNELATRYSDRIIVMDSPPLLLTSEAPALTRQAGQVVLVIESGKTTNTEIQESIDLLDSEQAINLVLNKSLHTQAGGYYGGNYGNYGFNEEG